MKKLYDTNQAADYLGTTMNTLKQSRNTGLLWGHPAPKFIKMGTAVRYRSDTLDKWLDSLPEEVSNTAQ
jgi:hypothetical protein